MKFQWCQASSNPQSFPLTFSSSVFSVFVLNTLDWEQYGTAPEVYIYNSLTLSSVAFSGRIRRVQIYAVGK